MRAHAGGAAPVIARVAGLFSGDALRARALRGTMITIASFGGSNVLRLASNLILTRLLFPEAFGLMALVQVVIVGLAMLSDTGVNMSILQNPRGLEPRFLRTAWTVQIGRGVLLWVATVALALPVASFYGEPILATMLPVIGLTVLIDGLNSTKLYTANRAMLLGRITAIDFASQVAAIAIMIGLAFLLNSVWALVIGSVMGTLIKTVLSHTAMPGHRDRLGWDREVFGELFRFGKWILVSSIAGFLIGSADRAILGKYIDIATLGIFNIGYFLATVPRMLSNTVGGRVLMPVFVAIVDDVPEVVRAKLRRTRVPVVGGLLVLSIGIAVFGEWAIDLLYDPQYALAGPILVLLTLSSALPLITSAYSSMMLAHGKSQDFTIYVCTLAAVQTTILLYGVSYYGVIGALIAPALSTVLVYPLTAHLAARRGGWDPALDAACFALLAAGTALALWVNPDAISAVLAGA